MKKLYFLTLICISTLSNAQSLSETQMQNARATGYAIIASKNPNIKFSVLVIPWDGVNSLEYNANTQINLAWHPQAVIKGNYFNQDFDGSDFTKYSSFFTSEEEFEENKHLGKQWWIVCSVLPSFSNSNDIVNIIKTNSNGNVGIGTNNPDAKLAVKGNIHANEVKVDLAVPADYVFQKYYSGSSTLNPSYQFRSLNEIKSFTEQHHHLPDLPSAKEIQENGLKLGEMNNLLLQKIEELTLHLIEQNSKIDQLTKEIKQLKQN